MMKEQYISVKIKKSLINKFTIIAAENNIPRKDLIESVMVNYLKAQGKINNDSP